MDTSWWLTVGVVVLLALVASLVDGLARLNRGRGSARPEREALPPDPLPRPGEIWWARVPASPGGEGERAGEGPCLVLAVRGGDARVVRITSNPASSDRAGVVALPPGTAGVAHGRPSFLETDEPREVALYAFRRRAGEVDPALWDQVEYLAD